MKQYIKDNIIKSAEEIVVTLDGHDYYNPTEEMIFADGWELYIEPEPPAPTLEEVKERKIIDLQSYDKSPYVNEFYINGMPLWFDAEYRQKIEYGIRKEVETGRASTTLWTPDGEISFVLPCDKALAMLATLEVYAKDSYNNTCKHINNINSLTTIEEVEKYDFTTGYPEKVRFTLN